MARASDHHWDNLERGVIAGISGVEARASITAEIRALRASLEVPEVAGRDSHDSYLPIGCIEHTWESEGKLGVRLREETVDNEPVVRLVGLQDELRSFGLYAGLLVLKIAGEPTKGKCLQEVLDHLSDAPRPLSVVFGDRDAQLEIASRIEYTWTEAGLLGITMVRADQDYQAVQLKAVSNVDAVQHGVVPGLTVVEVAGEPVVGVPYKNVIEMIKTQQRPLRIIFEDPPTLGQRMERQRKKAWYYLSHKVWGGEWTTQELQAWTAIAIVVPVPFLSYAVKLLTGGRTPTVADPLFMAMGLDNFASAAGENNIVNLAMAEDGGMSMLSGLTHFVEHIWENGPVGLDLEPMAHEHSHEMGAMVSNIHTEADIPEGKIYSGLLVAEVQGQHVIDKPFKEIVESLSNLPRPLTIKFVDITKLKATIYTACLVNFP